MHELSLVTSILEIVEEHARTHGAARVLAITVEVGDLACVELEALRLAFEVARKGTLAEQAELYMCRVEGRGRCAECGAEFAVAGFGEACPECVSFRVSPVGGTGLRVTELEVSD